MAQVTERLSLSLKWLQAFQAVAHHGTVRDGAGNLGISISTVSHHLSCLESALGAELFDHSRRPMRLTPAGQTLLRQVDEALWILRKGVSDIWSNDLQSMVRLLRIAHIEDFDNDVGPAMVQHLSRAIPQCDFSMLSRPTHEVTELLHSKQIDVGVASSTDHDAFDVIETPFLRDPFLLVAPIEIDDPALDLAKLRDAGDRLPLLRYSRKQHVGRQIEAQLRRLGARFPERMEFESTHAILSMVAAGKGWAITTALSFARAPRYHSEVRAMPFPKRPFARHISLICQEDLPPSIRGLIEDGVRTATKRLVIDPTVARYPWLEEGFVLL